MKNLMAAGSCELQSRGQRVRLISPHIETDKSKSWAPLPVRLILSLIHAPDTEVHDTPYPRGAKEIADDKYTTNSESDQRRRRPR